MYYRGIKSIWVVSIGLLLTIFFLFNFYLLSNKPTGILFWSQFYLAATSLIGVFILFGFKYYHLNKKTLAITSFSIGLIIFLFILVISYDYRVIFFPEAKDHLSKKEWKEDLGFLTENMKKRHPDLFALITNKAFEKQISFIEKNINEWNDDRIKIAFMKLVASLNDGHSIIPPQPAVNFNVLPIIIHKFDDGYFVVESDRKNNRLQNAKILQIGNHSIESLFNKIKDHIGAESELHKHDRFPLYACLTNLLYELKITNSPNEAVVQFEKEGKVFTEKITGIPFYSWYYFYLAPHGKNTNSPYAHRIQKNNFWIDFNQDTRTLYVNVNNLKDESYGETIKEFTERLKGIVAKNDFDKFIIDLRNNRGGDNIRTRPLFHFIRDNEKINQYGKLFTLISRRTFSAGVNLATLLENQTKTIFVGEGTGQGPTQFGDAKGFTLPNSGIWVAISSFKWQGSFSSDKRQSIAPDYKISYPFSDYLKGKDPAIAFIDNYKSQSRKRDKQNDNIDIVGRYLFDNDQIAEIKKNENGKLHLFATDFIEYSLRDINATLYPLSDSVFSTDISHLNIEVLNNRLYIKNDKEFIELNKVDAQFKLPMELLQEGKIVEGLQKIKSTYTFQKNNIEAQLNRLGYSYINKKEYQKALIVLQANADFYPQSANAWDSLGEVYMLLGNHEKAIGNYKYSLELNPANKNAKMMIAKLE